MTSPSELDEEALARLVDRFYDRVRSDEVLGPVFNATVHDWPEHKRLLTRFWSSVALRAGSYRGNPMAVHRALEGVREDHFVRWLALWKDTTANTLAPEHATRMRDYADRIGESLQLGMGLATRGRAHGLAIRDTD